MTIRKILAPVDGSPLDQAALVAAFALARRLAAHVDVLFARPTMHDAVPVVGEGASTTVMEQLVSTAEAEWTQREAVARRIFQAEVARAGLSPRTRPGEPEGATVGWRRLSGRVDRILRQVGPLADLVVLGRGAHGEYSAQLSPALEAALIACGRPTVVAPDVAPAIGTRVAVAWNGSTESGRAVAAALPLLRRAERVSVITIGTRRTEAARGAELAEYLAWHGVAAELDMVGDVHGRIGPALLARAAVHGADLLVMGGYGHSRIREFVLGGVTRHILTHAGLPVLVAH